MKRIPCSVGFIRAGALLAAACCKCRLLQPRRTTPGHKLALQQRVGGSGAGMVLRAVLIFRQGYPTGSSSGVARST